jgi:hypothetical protein
MEWSPPSTTGNAPGLVHVPDGLGDLVEGLLDVRRDGEDVAESAMVIDSRRSTPSSNEYGPYSAEILRIPCGPNRVPDR